MLPRFAPSDFFCLGTRTLLFLLTMKSGPHGVVLNRHGLRVHVTRPRRYTSTQTSFECPSPRGGGGGGGGCHLQEHCILPLLLGSLSNSVFERRTLTGSGLFFIRGQCFCQNVPAKCLYKRKETQQNKCGGFKVY